MTQRNEPPGEQRPPINMPNMAFLSVGGQVGCLTLVIVIISLVVGLALDRLLGTKPAFTIILVLGSAPVALFLTFWVAKRAINKIPPPAVTQAKPEKEDENSE